MAAVDSDGDERQRRWLARLPDVVIEVAGRWGLRLGEPYQPGGQTAWVAPVRATDGRSLVLKVGWRHHEADHEADGLRAWGGHGAVQLVDSWADDETAALLIERCVPGDALSRRPPHEQDGVVADVLRRLWVPPPAGHAFRPLEQMCQAWTDEAEADSRLDPGVARAGVELFRELPASASRRVLLATDLHAGNVLAAEREPWLAIDPKPWVGDPTYDPLQHMLNHPDRLATDPGGFADRMADLGGLDRDRLRLWLFARCVVGSGQSGLSGGDRLADVAGRLAP